MIALLPNLESCGIILLALIQQHTEIEPFPQAILSLQEHLARSTASDNMSLLELPHELFEAIITEVVRTVGIHDTVSARLVCKAFDDVVQRAIFSLPTFNGGMLWTEIPDRWKCKREMGIVMTTRLVASKMQSANAEQRELYCVITEAIDYLHTAGCTDSGLQGRCREALIARAGTFLSYWSISRRIFDALRPRTVRDEIPPGRAYGNALIAALYTGEGIESTLDCLLAQSDTPVPLTYVSLHFGSLLPALTRYGSGAHIRNVMSMHMPICTCKDNAAAEDCMKKPRQLLTAEAATEGRKDIISILLEPRYWPKSKVLGSEKAITNALEAGHEDIAVLLLSQPEGLEAGLPESEPTSHRRAGECFILDLARVCTERDYVSTMSFALERTKALHQAPDWLDSARGTHCQRGYVNRDSVDMQSIRRQMGRGGSFVTHYDLALFNAARCGSVEMMELILSHGIDVNDYSSKQFFGWHIHPLVAAARNGHTHMVQYLIRKGLGVKKCGFWALCAAGESVLKQGKDDAGLRELVEMLLDAGLEHETVTKIQLGSPARPPYARWFAQYMAERALGELLAIAGEEQGSRHGYRCLAEAGT
ncbi:hypothetical protein K491DRAFT_691395 [Lophiostoma macrostomum CBS 122681]|uniref:Uncharacterized protein n=1 Tax=Lophiostoma macrostomum CBS 122681 TaxID=1314788 RepID=A0A6A6TEX8_9PLEO|nr:hypothetical protein K491DRAFT_691395 [Lophiostoma macrostomum CBS 122681]